MKPNSKEHEQHLNFVRIVSKPVQTIEQYINEYKADKLKKYAPITKILKERKSYANTFKNFFTNKVWERIKVGKDSIFRYLS